MCDPKSFKKNGFAVLEPGSEAYERAVATSNLLFRFSRPAFVLQPETPEHVRTIVRLAQEADIKLTIKCGGHSYAGHSTVLKPTDVLLDLREMKEVHLNMTPGAETVTFGAGCQWGHVYKELVNKHYDGFIVNGGRCPFVGVGGFLLGGGLGPFSRTVGMGSDNVKQIRIVTADGKLVTVKDTDGANSNEGRLFWALCGAGGGNFGVVVEMTMAVNKLRGTDVTDVTDANVVAGRYQWFAKKGEGDLFEQDEFMSIMKRFYTTKWPERMTIDSTWICDLRQSSGNGVRFLTYFDGTKVEFDSIIDKLDTDVSALPDNDSVPTEYDSVPTQDELTKRSELVKQLKRRSLPEKSSRFLHETLVAQWSEETIKAFPTNKSYSIYSSFVFENDPYTIFWVTKQICSRAMEFREKFKGERVEFLATFIHSGGQTSIPKPDKSAFFWRDAVYHMYVTVEWEDKWMEGEMREFLDKAKEGLRTFSLKGKAAYVNFPDGALPKEKHEQAYWGENYKKLRLVKQFWDKDNFFKSPQGIANGPDGTPWGGSGQGEDEDEDVTDSLARKQWESYDGKDGFGAF